MRGFGIGVRMGFVVGLEIRIDGRGERGFHDCFGGRAMDQEWTWRGVGIGI